MKTGLQKEEATQRLTFNKHRFGGPTDSMQTVEENWWRRADSNCGPRDYETLALAS